MSDRVMSLKLEIKGVMFNVVSGYAPQIECELEKEKFWLDLDEKRELSLVQTSMDMLVQETEMMKR